MSQVRAMRYTLERVIRGLDTISVTGNILRDYLTDLFPIMELGTSAKMLSIVPLMAGGGMYETGAGGSAPKHVQQLVEENHLRWDSLGEFLALACRWRTSASRPATPGQDAGEDAGRRHRQAARQPQVALDPHRRARQPRQPVLPRLYWAQALAAQTEDKELQAHFAPLAKTLAANEQKIVAELKRAVQGKAVDIGGYYMPDTAKTEAVMRPSATRQLGEQAAVDRSLNSGPAPAATRVSSVRGELVAQDRRMSWRSPSSRTTSRWSPRSK
jgi:isocitrate dehydrogenase